MGQKEDMEMQLSYQESTETLYYQKKRFLQDMETGEMVEMDQIIKRAYGQKHFWKLYLMDFMTVLGILDSKQVDILIYIAENTSPQDNMFVSTQGEVAEATNCSRTTVSAVFKKLEKVNFIRKVRNGRYLVNPNIIMRGSDFKRKRILLEYENTAEIQIQGNTSIDVNEYTIIEPVVGHSDQLSKTMVEAGQQEFVKETVVREE